MSKKKSFVFEREKALYSADGTLGITFLKNIPKLEMYHKISVAQFARWNQDQEGKADWWIATAPFYSIQKIVSYFGYDIDQFTVYLPEEAHPIAFELDGMCFLIAPFLGFNYTGKGPDWKEQPQEELASNLTQQSQGDKNE
jgi:hypothetical protein